jgi:hypothetical protein
MSVAGGGGIFVSYRREESSHVAGRLADHLVNRFGAEQVFIDVEAIEPGVDFAEAIFLAIDACAVLVAVIGPGWLAAADQQGGRRLDDPDDLVSLEIGAALARRVRVIPVLVEGAVMPRREDLPDNLADFARRNALRVRHESFRDDAGRLIAAIERVVAAAAVADGAEDDQPARDVSGAMIKEDRGAGRNDPGRVARLLNDAERIANSITIEYEKSLVLSGLAEAVAVTDPDRAAGLLGEAERIANSLNGGDMKSLALSGVARVVAVTDPDRAERIARSITHRSAEVRTLSHVARALGATDPDRAARLAEEAERIAERLTSKFGARELSLSYVAEAMAVTDPDRAERIANSITSLSAKVEALSKVAKAVAATDPDRAARLADDAERIANSRTTENTKAKALSYVAKAVAVTDPDRAARLADDAERIANSMTEENVKAKALIEVAGAVAVTDPDRALRIVISITSERTKARALSSIAKALTE